MPKSHIKYWLGRGTRPIFAPRLVKGSTKPISMMDRVITMTGREARLWIKGIYLVRIIWTTKVWVRRPTTNQPDWKSGAWSSVFAPKIVHIIQKVAISKTEEIGPTQSIKCPISSAFHCWGSLIYSKSIWSQGRDTCEMLQSKFWARSPCVLRSWLLAPSLSTCLP